MYRNPPRSLARNLPPWILYRQLTRLMYAHDTYDTPCARLSFFFLSLSPSETSSSPRVLTAFMPWQGEGGGRRRRRRRRNHAIYDRRFAGRHGELSCRGRGRNESAVNVDIRERLRPLGSVDSPSRHTVPLSIAALVLTQLNVAKDGEDGAKPRSRSLWPDRLSNARCARGKRRFIGCFETVKHTVNTPSLYS